MCSFKDLLHGKQTIYWELMGRNAFIQFTSQVPYLKAHRGLLDTVCPQRRDCRFELTGAEKTLGVDRPFSVSQILPCMLVSSWQAGPRLEDR